MIRIASLLCLLLFTQCSIAQTAQSGDYVTKKTANAKAKRLYDRGVQYSRANENKKALKDFESSLKIEPKFIDAQFMWAGVQYNMKNIAAAEQGFEKGIALDPLYSAKALNQLAYIEKEQKKYDEAAKHFQAYIDHPKAKNVPAATKQLASVSFAAAALKNPVPFSPVSLGIATNTEHMEYLPSLSADGELLVFTRRIGRQEDFYFSKNVNGEWMPAEALDAVNTQFNEGAQNISADGKFLIFASNNDKSSYGSFDLFYSEVKNGTWTKPKNMGQPINSRSWESQPSISADRQTLYFVSDRADGKDGNSDIYTSTRKADGTWSTPKAMSNVINTDADEQAPFIHPDGQTLYFVSQGHPGMGGDDLFLSRKQADGTWGKPQNLGYPINTDANEGCLVVSLDGSTAYYFSDRDPKTNKKKASADLYSFPLHEKARPLPVTYVKATISDAETTKKLRADVNIIDLKTGAIHSTIQTDNDGTFLICLPLGKNYALNISKEKYLFHSENFALDQSSSLTKPYLIDIALQAIPDVIIASNDAPKPTTSPTPLPEVKPIILRNVFFETASAALKDESLNELNRLKTLLIENKAMQIQLNGHTDNVGNDAANLKLSNERAKAVYDFLVKNGINPTRLSYKGFGASKPIDTNDTPEGRQNNRRTTFTIIN